MADSVDEEYDPQPSISKNANTLQSSSARTAEARRRPGRETPELLGASASEDETEAPPQKSFRQPAGLRDRSRTEITSSNQRRAAPGGNQSSKFKRPEYAHPRSGVRGNNESLKLGKAALEDSLQVDPNTLQDVKSYDDDSEGERYSQFGLPGNSRPGRLGVRRQISEASQRRIINPRRAPRELTRSISKISDPNTVFTYGQSHEIIDLSDDGGVSSPGGRRGVSVSPTRPQSIRYVSDPDDTRAAPSTPSDSLSASSILLLKFSSISNNTISKDKTQGEEAHNSELLAAFGQKIQARCFREISNQSIDPAVHQAPPIGTAITGLIERPLIRTPPPPPWFYGMEVQNLPSSTSLEAFRIFLYQSGLEFRHLESSVTGHVRVDFETALQLKAGMDRLYGHEFRGARLRCSTFRPGTPGSVPPPSPQGLNLSWS